MTALEYESRLKTPPTARAEVTEHITDLEALIERHTETNAALVARVAERDQVIAALRGMVRDYRAVLTHLPEDPAATPTPTEEPA